MGRLRLIELSTAFLALNSVSGCAARGIFGRSNDTALPIVDLGYEIHQARSLNTTGDYYTFSNIRYAAPPVGDLRFNAPQLPKVNRSAVQTGSQDRICPQAVPEWINTANQFVPRYLKGESEFNESSFNSSTPPAKPDPRQTEDCLFLDVSVPREVFKKAGGGYGAPVLAWIHGGGYTVGSKTDSGNPAGLLHVSQNSGQSGVIFVSINYRLGAFGFLSGPTLTQANGTTNAGLYDQRMALEWIQNNIAKFGGDPDRVTLIGESAGGGSVLHQLMAFGDKSVPFAQAIPQSPGYLPRLSNRYREGIVAKFLKYANASSVQDARGLSSATLQAANLRQVSESPYGTFTFNPDVDGNFIPASPAELLQQGRFDKTVRLMVGHNENEGLLFTSPFVKNESDLKKNVINFVPTMKNAPEAMDYLLHKLYPAPGGNSSNIGQRGLLERTAKFDGDAFFICNFFFLAKAYQNTSYAYKFSVPPALHGDDIAYTFYNGPSSLVTASKTAVKMQQYIINFALSGSPNGRGLPTISKFGKKGHTLILNETDVYETLDKSMEERCSWWEKGLYY